MLFDDLLEIEQISRRVGCAVFVLPDDATFAVKNATILEPENKATITIEQVRDVMNTLSVKQTDSRFIVIRPAHLLSEAAENAILKILEEPGENVHFILVTDEPSKLLPTILSRAAIYVWRGTQTSVKEIRADEKIKTLAKRLLSAKPADLVDLADELTKKKDGVRGNVLKILGVAIEMAYKSYLLTEKRPFIDKMDRLLRAYDAISQNGHIKLHLVADLC